MKPSEILRRQLGSLDGQDYGAYQSLKGGWDYGRFGLLIDRIPKDPYAPAHAGVYRARVAWDEAGFPAESVATPVRAIALRDFLARRFAQACARHGKGRRGTGNSGLISIAEPGQAYLERSSVVVNEDFIEARFFVGLPAQGRRIDSGTAGKMLFEEVPGIVAESLFAESLDMAALRLHLQTAEDNDHLRRSLEAEGLVAFVADGAVLPRASGLDDRPLDAPHVVPFRPPDSLRVTIDLPNAGPVSGMGIPEGVTLIVGGGYHGKSTLLQALEAGIYAHIPGDGRERCVALPDTVKVRAANGRAVTGVDISPFIRDIPFGDSTESFSTTNASGSTSQAAFISESIEAGADVLLMDEDTCATNFLIRDRRMQELVAKKDEPITAFVDVVRQLHKELGISTILVMGGSGDYFSTADCVIQMTDFQPREVTGRAHEIAERLTTRRVAEGGAAFPAPRPRRPVGDEMDPRNEHGKVRVSAADRWHIIFGRGRIDLSDMEQIAETAQTRAIGLAILRAAEAMDGAASLREITESIIAEIDAKGLDVLDPNLTGDLARFRGLELAAAINRMRELKVKPA